MRNFPNLGRSRPTGRRRSFGYRIMGLLALLAFAVFEPVTPAYWLALAMYYESRDEPFIGRWAVANVVYNRVESRRWPRTVYGVVNDGRERGRRCDFSFMCDGKPENPWRHKRRYWAKWLQIRAEAWLMVALQAVDLRSDPTGGALYYKRRDARSPWFARQLAAGKMRRVRGNFGAHEFFK